MTIALLSLPSCRQDLLPEKETYRNTSAFQLTSKRISLDEAKHKDKLLPELQKAKKEVEKQKLNIQGKLVDIGNGIMIDTDEVIYMENGPDFHTYTFSVVRDNASANAPVENILMSPNTDGSYRVFHIVLNLTEADKAKIANREYVDYKNKEQVTELSNINLSSLSQKQICVPHYYSYAVPCQGPEEHMPGQAGCPLEGGERAYWGTLVLYDCFGEQHETIMPTPAPIDGGGGGGGGGEGQEPPDDCTSLATDPTQVGLVSPSGCNIGVPTEPYLPNPADNPCRKTNASITAANTVLKNPTVQSQMDAVLKGKRTLENEWSTALGIKSDGSYDITPAIEQQQNSGNSPDDLLSNPSSFFADGHTHSGDPAKPSAGDLYGMLNEVFYNANFKYRYVYGDSDMGTPEVYVMVLNDRAAAIEFRGTYLESENYDIDKHGFKEGSDLWKVAKAIKNIYSKISTINTSGEDYDAKAVAMAYLLENLNAGISVAKVDNNGNLKKINVILKEITNSDGTKGQRVKVSKCP